MSQSSPEGIILGPGSKLVSASLSVNDEKVFESTREIAVRTYKDLIESNKMFDTPLVWTAWKRAFDTAKKEFKR